ncbi:MAG: hypothetical protein M3347_11920 [Armatimonadota bacterium]|nr:hypothetical protein [Armatimonadota bacterium]
MPPRLDSQCTTPPAATGFNTLAPAWNRPFGLVQDGGEVLFSAFEELPQLVDPDDVEHAAQIVGHSGVACVLARSLPLVGVPLAHYFCSGNWPI